MPFCLRVFLQEVAVRFFVQKYDFSKSFSSIAHTRRHTRFTDKPEDEALRDVFITFAKRKQIFTICQTLAEKSYWTTASLGNSDGDGFRQGFRDAECLAIFNLTGNALNRGPFLVLATSRFQGIPLQI